MCGAKAGKTGCRVERISAQSVSLKAAQDINNTGGTVVADNNLVLQAGHDINVTSTSQSSAGTGGAYSFSQSGIDRMATLYTRGPGTLLARAGNNVNLTAAQISSAGDVQIQAANNLTLSTLTRSRSDNIGAGNADNHFLSASSQDAGTTIQSAGNTALKAGNTLTATAAQVNATGNLSLNAQDIALLAGTARASSDSVTTSTTSGLLSSSTTVRRSSSDSALAQASTLSGKNVSVQADNNAVSVGSKFLAQESIDIGGANQTMLYATQDVTRNQSETHTTSSFLGINLENKISTDSLTQSTAIATRLVSTQKVEIGIGNKAELQGTEIDAMRQTAEAERAIKNEAVKQMTNLTDEAYKKMFQTTPKFYKVTCPDGVDCTSHPEKAQSRLMTGTLEDIQKILNAAPSGAVLAVNGIDNPLDRAGQLAMQNAVPRTMDSDGNLLEKPEKPKEIYLMHYEPANNGLSELLVAAYEQKLASTLGYTNQDVSYAQGLQAMGETTGGQVVSQGHSRGTIVQTNANTILVGQGFTNPNLSVQGAGGAVTAKEFTDAAAGVIKDPRKIDDNVTFAYFKNDPVPVGAGGNPGVLSLSEFWRVITTANSAHSCYGTGAAGCQQVQILTPNAPPKAVQDNSNLVEYKGGKLVEPSKNLAPPTRK